MIKLMVLASALAILTAIIGAFVVWPVAQFWIGARRNARRRRREAQRREAQMQNS